MKITFSLTALFISISLLLFHTNSFTTAEIKNEAALFIAKEDRALIAIRYTKGNKLAVTNNNGTTIEIEKIELMSNADHQMIKVGENESPSIMPGRVKEFTIPGNPKDLTGKVIQITVHWNGGRAEIKSTIPEIKSEHKEG
ncbi:MAG TPA: hypothetical protein VGI04_12465 [Neobacillus sp.]